MITRYFYYTYAFNYDDITKLLLTQKNKHNQTVSTVLFHYYFFFRRRRSRNDFQDAFESAGEILEIDAKMDQNNEVYAKCNYAILFLYDAPKGRWHSYDRLLFNKNVFAQTLARINNVLMEYTFLPSRSSVFDTR